MKATIIENGKVTNIIELADDWIDTRGATSRRVDGKRHWRPPENSIILTGEEAEQATMHAIYDSNTNTFTAYDPTRDPVVLKSLAIEAAKRAEEEVLLESYLDNPDAPEEVKRYRELLDSRG